MRKIASMHLDVVDHIVNDEIEKLASIVEHLSDDAQVAYIPSIEELETRKDKDFAAILWDPQVGTLRKFAKFTPELAELNMAFLVNTKNSLPEEIVKVAAANLTCAAMNFGLSIPNELESYKSDKFINNMVDLTNLNKVSYMKKTAKQESSKYFALPNKYPINTELEIKKAGAFFEKNHHKLSINDKREFLTNIQDRAKELDVSLTKTAVEHYSSLKDNLFNEDLYNHIQVRKSYLKNNEEEVKIAYDELVSRADEIGPLNVAYVLEEIDKTAQLNKNYGKGILDPLASVLGEEKRAGREIDGVLITHDSLKGIDEGVMTSLVGNDVLKEIKGEEGLDVFASLPRPIRADIIKHL